MKSKFWKVLLHKDSFLLFVTILGIWFTISLLVDINYDFQKLHLHTGKVSDIQTVITKLKNKPFYKDTIRELQIRFVNNTQYFTISTHSNFNDITRTISKGDTVTIYTKDKVFGIFGYGNPQTIAHLVKTSTNKILIDFHEKQQSFASIIILIVLLTLIFLIWYIVKVRHRLWWELRE